MSERITCNDITHRQGFVEVTPGIHDRCINVETWNVSAQVDISNRDVRDHGFPDDAIISNTEIELSVSQARSMVRELENAIRQVDVNKGGNR